MAMKTEARIQESYQKVRQIIDLPASDITVDLAGKRREDIYHIPSTISFGAEMKLPFKLEP